MTIQLTSIRSRGKDNSMGFSGSTPELQPEEQVEFMRLNGINLDTLFSPLDEPKAEEIKVKSELHTKTQGQRVRAVIFILWKQSGEKEPFETFYQNKTEKIINFLKEQLEN